MKRWELAVEMRRIIDSGQLFFWGLLVTDAARGNSELLAWSVRVFILNLPYLT